MNSTTTHQKFENKIMKLRNCIKGRQNVMFQFSIYYHKKVMYIQIIKHFQTTLSYQPFSGTCQPQCLASSKLWPEMTELWNKLFTIIANHKIVIKLAEVSNSCYSELCIKWKNPDYRGGQTKMAYFFLLKITYRNTNQTPYKHFIGRM